MGRWVHYQVVSVPVERQVLWQAMRMQSGETGAITGCEYISGETGTITGCECIRGERGAITGCECISGETGVMTGYENVKVDRQVQ